jgi:hypothetical protein
LGGVLVEGWGVNCIYTKNGKFFAIYIRISCVLGKKYYIYNKWRQPTI